MLGVEDSVELAVIAPPPVDPVLQLHPTQEATVVFASFVNATRQQTQWDINAILTTGRTLFSTGSRDSMYPAGRGGAGLGLEFNKVTVVIACDRPVQGVRITPASTWNVFSSSGDLRSAQGGEMFVGTTIEVEGVEGSSLRFAGVKTMVLRHAADCSIQRVQLFVDTPDEPRDHFFALQPNNKTARFCVSDGGLERLGGAHTELVAQAYAATVAVVQHRQELVLLSLHEQYSNESLLYEALRADANQAMPGVSRISRACESHTRHSRNALNAMATPPPPPTSTVQVDATLYQGALLVGDVHATALTLALNRQYDFGPPFVFVTAAGTTTGVCTLTTDAPTALVQHDGATICTITGVDASPRVVHDIQPVFPGTPVQSLLQDLDVALPHFTTKQTPNRGRRTAHAAFRRDDGEEMTYEESLFLPGQLAALQLVRSERFDVEVRIDDEVVATVADAPLLSLLEVTLPTRPGLHVLSCTNGSSVPFRVSAVSVVYPPTHPPFYTTGQLEGDPKSRAPLTFIVEHPNFDLLVPMPRVAASSSDARFLTVPAVEFDADAMACTAAYFCRHERWNLLGAVGLVGGAEWGRSSQRPHLSHVDLAGGFVTFPQPTSTASWFLRWKPGAQQATLLECETFCLYVRQFVIHIRTAAGVRRATAAVTEEWHLLSFADDRLQVDGVHIGLEPSDDPPLAPLDSAVVFGNPSTLLVEGAAPLPFFLRGTERLAEAKLSLHAATPPGTVELGDETSTQVWTRVGEFYFTDDPWPPAYTFVRTGGELATDVRISFASAGLVRSACFYREQLPVPTLTLLCETEDCVPNFGTRTVEASCTNDAQATVRGDVYTQTNSVSEGQDLPQWVLDAHWLRKEVQSSFFVTPPSLVLLRLGQESPYSVFQSIDLEFNRGIEIFPKNDTTLLVLRNLSDPDVDEILIPTAATTLFVSSLNIPNFAFELELASLYELELLEGVIYQAAGHVPNVGAKFTFFTENYQPPAAGV